MNEFYELQKLPDKEIKNKLSGKQIKIGDFCKYVGGSEYTPFILLYRYKDKAIIKFDRNDIKTCYFEDIEKYTYADYRNFIEEKLKEMKYINTEKTFVSFLKNHLKSYKEENIDIVIKDNIIYLTILYPELPISNSMGATHTMKDLYLTFKFYRDSDYWRLGSISLFRGKYTVGEVACNYVFSHSNAIPGSVSTSFCFGDGIIRELYKQHTNKCILPDLSYFITVFENYLQWESIEGGPYRYISNIKEYDIVYDSVVFTSEECTFFYEKAIQKLSNFTYTFEVKDSDYYIKLSEESKQEIKEILFKLAKEYKNDKILGRNIDGVIGEIKEKTGVRLRENQYITFKGKEVYSEIIDSKQNLEEVKKRFPIEVRNDFLQKIVALIEASYKDFYNNEKLSA